MGIAEIGFYFLLEKDFQKIFFLNSDSMYRRKMYGLVRCIPILGRGGRGGRVYYKCKKNVYMCICDYIKNDIGSCKKCVFRFEKGYKRMNVLDSCKTYCLYICFI